MRRFTVTLILDFPNETAADADPIKVGHSFGDAVDEWLKADPMIVALNASCLGFTIEDDKEVKYG